jgi:branched-chain amino acid transport system ATP-binding protein
MPIVLISLTDASSSGDEHLHSGTSMPSGGVHPIAYGGLVAVDGVSLTLDEGEVLALVGANGAGKSSLLKAIARVEPSAAQEMRFGGDDLSRLSMDATVARGICLVPEGRALFGSLTVAQNLAAGRYARRRARGFSHLLHQSREERVVHEARLAMVYELFPVLKERARQLAGTLSGGQGQMLAIGRALMGEPRLLMLDEPSLGLAPQVIDEIFASIERLKRQGLTILLVEQNIAGALTIADRGMVLANGRIAASGTGRELLRDPRITEAYLGTGDSRGPACGDPPRFVPPCWERTPLQGAPSRHDPARGRGRCPPAESSPPPRGHRPPNSPTARP